MSNLLPLSEQKKVWATYRARFIIAASAVGLFFALVASLALLPSALALELAAPPVPQIGGGQRAAAEEINAIARAQSLLSAAKSIEREGTTTAAYIAAALATRPAGVTIEHIAITPGEKGQLTLDGTGNRDAISAYRTELSRIPSFTEVSVPVNALVGSNDGQFSITISGAF